MLETDPNSIINFYDEAQLAGLYESQFRDFQRDHDRGSSLTYRFSPLDKNTMTHENIKLLSEARTERKEILVYWDGSHSYSPSTHAATGYVVESITGLHDSEATIRYYTQNSTSTSRVRLNKLHVVSLGNETRSTSDYPARNDCYLIQSRRTSRPLLLRHSRGDSRGFYGSNNSVWLDSDFQNRSFQFFPINNTRPLSSAESSNIEIIRTLLLNQTQADTDTVANGAPYVNTSTVQSPNANKTFRGHNVATLNGDTLLGFLVSLRSYAALVAEGVVTQEQVAKVSAFSAKELSEGEALLKSEIEFRFKKEALEEVARLEAEAEQLKSREERQREVTKKLAALKASLGTDVVTPVE